VLLWLIKIKPRQLFSVTVSQALVKQAPAMAPPGDRRTQWRGWGSWLTLGALLLGGLNARASTLNVSSTADSGAGTLRAQIAAAAPGDTIHFSVTGTIALASEIAIAQDLTIAGPGASSLTVSDSGNSIFAISGGLVGISGLTLANGGYGDAAGGAIYMTGGTVTVAGSVFSGNNAGNGGAIYMSGGSLAITSSTFSNNIADSSGGAIDAVGGSLAVTNSTFLRNSAVSFGGAIFVSGDTLVLASSTISMNSAGDGGGIIAGVNGGGSMVTIQDSTISSNTANYFPSGQIGDGGGIHNNSSMKILNSTISGNSSISSPGTATYVGGGGIFNNGTLTIANSTITLNIAADGGGILMEQGALNLSNSIVANNTFAGGGGYDIDFSAGFTSGDYNLVQSFYANFSSTGTLPGSHNITGQPALLGPLTNNGGPTLTHALLLGSPAIAAGDPNFNATGTPYDQRGPGFPRVLNGGLSIGAIEIEPNQSGSNFVVNSLADHDYGTCGLTDGSLREAVEYSPAGATITFGVTGTITLTLGELLINKNLTITGPASAPGITVSGNHASGIFTVTNGAALVNLSTLTLCSGNGSGGNGGALDVGIFSPPPIVNVTNCTFSGNTAFSGGAIRSGGTLTLTSCTLSGNSATNNGGAIQNAGALTVTSCTFSGNSALSATATGGGINVRGGTLSLFNTIVAGNTASNGADIYGLVSAGDYDLVQNPAGATLTGSHNITGQPALLGPLASNGGPTPTRALLAGSPAIDAGRTTLTTDQRGVARPQGAADDIGAFELGPIYSPTLSIQSIPLAQVQISWYTVTNAAYQLQYCSALTPDQWTPVSLWIVGGGQMISTNDPILAGQPQRFYRVAVTNSP